MEEIDIRKIRWVCKFDRDGRGFKIFNDEMRDVRNLLSSFPKFATAIPIPQSLYDMLSSMECTLLYTVIEFLDGTEFDGIDYDKLLLNEVKQHANRGASPYFAWAMKRFELYLSAIEKYRTYGNKNDVLDMIFVKATDRKLHEDCQKIVKKTTVLSFVSATEALISMIFKYDSGYLHLVTVDTAVISTASVLWACLIWLENRFSGLVQSELGVEVSAKNVDTVLDMITPYEELVELLLKKLLRHESVASTHGEYKARTYTGLMRQRWLNFLSPTQGSLLQRIESTKGTEC